MAFLLGTTANIITISPQAAEWLRPHVIEIVRQNVCHGDGGLFNNDWSEAVSLASAFNVTPREVGFDYANWTEYGKARANIAYPDYNLINNTTPDMPR